MNGLYPKELLGYLPILFIFFRMLGLFLLVPGFSHPAIAAPIKLLLALAISFAIYPLVRSHLGGVPAGFIQMGLLVTREAVIGLLMGFVAYLTFEAIHLGGQFIGYQVGFGTVGLLDPHTHSQVSVLAPLQGWLALMVFFLVDMHHILLRLFVISFETTAPLAMGVEFKQPLYQLIVGVSGRLFLLAIQMAAPFTLLILLINAALGVLARVLPQMNVLLFSFPVTILLGLFALYVFAPELLEFIDERIGEMATHVATVLKVM